MTGHGANAPAHWPRRALILLVQGYRLLLSPMLRARCRFEPSCSAYALGALEAHGAAAGSCLAVQRLLRCHPFCAGGHDPVPQRPPAFFTRFLSVGPALQDADDQPPSTSIPQSPR